MLRMTAKVPGTTAKVPGTTASVLWNHGNRAQGAVTELGVPVNPPKVAVTQLGVSEARSCRLIDSLVDGEIVLLVNLDVDVFKLGDI